MSEHNLLTPSDIDAVEFGYIRKKGADWYDSEQVDDMLDDCKHSIRALYEASRPKPTSSFYRLYESDGTLHASYDTRPEAWHAKQSISEWYRNMHLDVPASYASMQVRRVDMFESES